MPWQYYLSVAGVTMQIETDHPLVENEAFLPFLVTERDADYRVIFKQVNELPEASIANPRDGYVYLDGRGTFRRFFYETPYEAHPYAVSGNDASRTQIYVNYLAHKANCVSDLQNSFYHVGIESLMIRKERLCLHAACVQTSLGGLLFSGKSGIGKSTQAALWETYRGARQINGDRPILSKTNGIWEAWGSPYAGSSRCYVNESCTITAVIMLRQGAECSLRRLSMPEAFRAIWAGLTVHSRDRIFVETASMLAMDLIESVPVFEFTCTPDEASVDYLEKELRKECGL